MNAVSIKNLDVIFGNNIKQSLTLLDQGKSRQDIIAENGDVVGVQNASLNIKQGEICVLMGLSGSGKSSLLRAVNGLNTISRGQLLIQDGDSQIDLANCDSQTLRHLRAKRVSMVFQKFALMPWLSVLDNVAFGLDMQGISKTERHRRAMIQLEMVGLAEWKDKYPHELSGGMQQRVGLARAFAMDSDILLMDEPFSALDPLIRNQLQDELIELQQKLNKTIIFVSHDLDEALKIGTNIAIMESAQIIQHGPPEQIVLNPANEYVRDFVAHTNPLNVLRGRSLMTPVAELATLSDYKLIHATDQTSIKLNDNHQVIHAKSSQGDINIRPWQLGEDISLIPQNTLVTTTAEVSMRDAIEICYHTGRPLLLTEQNSLLGVLSEKNFYHALLGKHFS